MRTVKITLNDTLIDAVDRVVKELKTNRSAFTRKALKDALVRYKLEEQELKHRRGYEIEPVSADEFSVWEAEQVLLEAQDEAYTARVLASLADIQAGRAQRGTAAELLKELDQKS